MQILLSRIAKPFDTRYHAVERNLPLSFNTQAGAFYSGRRIAATFGTR
ncbi:hypothetical protein CAMGR0001_0791 [Campylobacter gracilis RM3268]|uniref:Uncharacterized protein n=1 Tax=Campylobacter gracilis RM3268 TaxID=553220 RepID=C8PFZ8_9BACT|nr:hypothetical protein CAMGR0001_0791 [Campylobacter gracilis RM3268]